MASSLGLNGSDGGGLLDKLTNTWLSYQAIKNRVDVETIDDDRNYGDYQDVADGRPAGGDNSPAGLNNWGPVHWIGAGALFLLAGYATFKLVK